MDNPPIPPCCPRCGAPLATTEPIPNGRGPTDGPVGGLVGERGCGPHGEAAGSGLPGLDPVELLAAARALVESAKRLNALVGDVEWFAQPWRIEGGDEYSDLRDHVDAAGREARAAARVLYFIGQNAITDPH